MGCIGTFAKDTFSEWVHTATNCGEPFVLDEHRWDVAKIVPDDHVSNDGACAPYSVAICIWPSAATMRRD